MSRDSFVDATYTVHEVRVIMFLYYCPECGSVVDEDGNDRTGEFEELYNKDEDNVSLKCCDECRADLDERKEYDKSFAWCARGW